MKFIWEESDIKTGRIYTRPDIHEDWMIAYLSDIDPDNLAKYTSVSLSDGLIIKASTREDMAQMLTENEYIPKEYIF